ncbi:hypothetical protein [Rhodococcus opacus]|uniref:hypothetical protein n=1 Tax=Rhodococcus opacus TaxID=37919 RepID=UPI001F516226|nr:hypothetical protein [Rhodococcus opacus]
MPNMRTSTTKSVGAEIRASFPSRPQRFPKVINFKDIESMPRLPFSKGCASGVFISREREDSRYYTQGYCFHDSDMEDFVWDETAWDEAFYCVKGQLRLHAVDADGAEADYVVDEGDHFWAPAGFKYTFRASGVDSINFWTMAPVQQSGWKYTGDDPSYSDALIAMRDNPEL